jgi:hypothetical protein
MVFQEIYCGKEGTRRPPILEMGLDLRRTDLASSLLLLERRPGSSVLQAYSLEFVALIFALMGSLSA